MGCPLVSVIVPYYNTGKYLAKCVDSIMNQTFKDFEVILVDDGSQDDSAVYADRYALDYSNVKSVHKTNGGCNSARQFGLSFASGSWINFVDSDDSIPEDSLDTLTSAISDNTDIIVGFSFADPNPGHILPIGEWRKALVRSNILLCTPWGKLFRKGVLSDECFRLKGTVTTSSDMLMNIKVSYRTEKDVTFVQPRVYFYTERPGSLSANAKWTLTRISQLFDEVVNSVPEDKLESVADELIENRLIALKGKFLRTTSKNKESLAASDYVLTLRKDIERSGYELSCLQRMGVYHSDSVFTVCFYKLNNKFLVLRQIIKKKFGL